MGCVFSRIYDNHIYNIAVKHEFCGYEISVFSGLTGYESAPADLDEYVEWVEKDAAETWKSIFVRSSPYTQRLGSTRIVEEAYVTSEDEPVILDHDLEGEPRGTCPTAGLLEGLKDGFNRIKVWG